MKRILLLITLLFSTCCFMAATANPIVAPGGFNPNQVNIQQNGSTMIINQSSPTTFINWNQFNIQKGETTTFNQPSRNSVAVNRVNATNGLSQIYGTLNANGKIVLINQAGIFFGPTAFVNVGSIIASTSDMSKFNSQHYVFDLPSKNPYAAIVNKGTINAANYGLVALIGNRVENNGNIIAHAGTVIMGAGNTFTLDFTGDQLLNFSIDEATSNNKGSAQAIKDLGMIRMRANVAQKVLDNAINTNYYPEALHFSELSDGELIFSKGKIDVSDNNPGQQGGTVKLLASRVNVSNATIDASGDSGGGVVLMGGNYQGKGPDFNATTTSVDAGTIINASATRQGNGGKVIVWANDTTDYAGNIIATGGTNGGDGGFVEVSGHDLLNYQGIVNLTAPHGKTGELLLDPENLTIQATGPTDVAYDSSTNTYSSYYDSVNNVDHSILTVADLANQLNLANITVLTGSSGSQAGTITVAYPLVWTSKNSLTLHAASTININAPIEDPAGGNLTLNSDNGAINLSSSITLSGGTSALAITNATNVLQTSSFAPITASSLTANVTGSLQLNGSNNNITNLGPITAPGGFYITNGSNPITATAAISATSGGINITSGGYTQNTNVGLDGGSGGIGIYANSINIHANSGDALLTSNGDIGLGSSGSNISLGGNITTNGGNISFNGPLALTQGVTLNTGTGGNITFSNTVQGNSNALTAESAGSNLITFNNVVSGLSSLSTTGNTAINTTSITTSGAQDYNGNVTLGAGSGTTLTSQNGNGITISGTTNGPQALIIAANSGQTNLGSVGNITPLASLLINTGNTTNLSNVITTTGSQTYLSAVTFTSPTILNTTNSPIDFASSIDPSSPNQAITMNAGSGDITIAGKIGNASAVGNLALNSTGTITLEDSINADSLTTSTGSTTNLNSGEVTTSGNQIFNGVVNLGAATVLTTDAGNIAFNGALSGPGESLTLNGGANGDHTFTIHDVTSLASLTMNGNTSVKNTANLTGYTQPVVYTLDSNYNGTFNTPFTSYLNNINTVTVPASSTIQLPTLATANMLVFAPDPNNKLMALLNGVYSFNYSLFSIINGGSLGDTADLSHVTVSNPRPNGNSITYAIDDPIDVTFVGFSNFIGVSSTTFTTSTDQPTTETLIQGTAIGNDAIQRAPSTDNPSNPTSMLTTATQAIDTAFSDTKFSNEKPGGGCGGVVNMQRDTLP